MNTIQKISIAIALPVVLLMSGCAVQGSTHADPKASSATVEKPAPAPVTDPLVKKFGEVVTYKDGVSVSVSPAAPYTPSPEAAGATAGMTYIQVTLVVTNNSDKTLDQAGWPTATSGGQQAAAISDFGQNIGDTPAGPLLAGQTMKWNEAFSVADAADITIAYSPSFEYKNAIFTSK